MAAAGRFAVAAMKAPPIKILRRDMSTLLVSARSWGRLLSSGLIAVSFPAKGSSLGGAADLLLPPIAYKPIAYNGHIITSSGQVKEA